MTKEKADNFVHEWNSVYGNYSVKVSENNSIECRMSKASTMQIFGEYWVYIIPETDSMAFVQLKQVVDMVRKYKVDSYAALEKGSITIKVF